MLNSLMIRVAAGGTLVVGGLLFAAESGLIGSASNAATADQAGTEQTLSSESRPSGSMSPELPEFQQFNVNIPMAEQTLAPQAAIMPASFEDPPRTQSVPMMEEPQLSDLGLPCGVSVTATAMPAALVALDVMAPCRTNAQVTINHAGLEIIASTDALGLLTLDLPAFETPAVFAVTFADGVEESVLVGLPDLSDFDRIGVAWQGNMGLELHAMEFGAGFGEQGHIWLDAPNAPDDAIAGVSGFLSMIEAGESYAHIYTLPRSTLSEGHSVRLSIDAPITLENCTQNVVARTLRTQAAGPVAATELTFTVPGCDAVGDVLVLQNLLDDLRLASN